MKRVKHLSKNFFKYLLFFGFIVFLNPSLYGFDDQNLPWHHALSLYNTPKYSENFKHFDYVNPNAPQKGTFELRLPGTFDSLNPYILKGIPAEGRFLTGESLMQKSADEPLTMYGRIAEKMQIPEDRSWIRFKLRPEARFHDNSPITAEDIAFSFELMRTKSRPDLRSFYEYIYDVQILGSRDIVFYLKTRNNRHIPLMIGFMPILSKKYYTNHDFDKPGLDIPLTSGPYIITKIDQGKKIIYKKNPNFWGKDLAINVGHYNFDEIHYHYIRDDAVSMQAFQKHDYDFREEPNIMKWSHEYNFQAVKDKRVDCKSFPVAHTLDMHGLVMNLRKEIFADYRIRQALTLALDFDWLNRNYLHDAYQRTDSFFIDPQMIAHATPTPEELIMLEPFKDQLPSFIFSKPVEEFIPTNIQKSRADLNKAKNLLKEAGWIIQNNQLIHEKTHQRMEFEILLALPFYEKIVHSYAHNLAKLGIKATIRTVESTQYEKRLQDHDFGMIIHYWTQSYYPGCEQSFYWGSTQAPLKGSKNYAGIANPAIDYLISNIPKAQNLETYLASTRALDRLLRAHQFVIPLFQPKENHCAFWDKFGFPDKSPPHGFRHIRMWALHTWWEK